MTNLEKFVKKFCGVGYRIVSTGDLTEFQIAEAKRYGQLFVDSDSLGYVALPWELTTAKDEARFHLKLMAQNKEIKDTTGEA